MYTYLNLFRDDGYVLLFNDSVNAAKLVLGCGSLPAFHRVSNEGEEYYVFNLFHPSLCGIRQSVMYTLIVVIICTSVLTIGYCLSSCLIKKCLTGLSWYESIPYIDTFENINSRFKNYIVLHCHRRQTRLAEPVYTRVPNDSPEHSDSNNDKKFGSVYDDLTEQKQQLLSSNTDESLDDDVLLSI
ncbi:unnamed protein product [Trichobilharzia szidati]|nr:unnamed protein product [Trichobilharzia szidati]